MAAIGDIQTIFWFQNDTYPVLQIPLYTLSGPDNISGVSVGSFALKISNYPFGTGTAGSSTFAINTFSPAVINLTVAAADVATPGEYYWQISCTFPGASNPSHFSLIKVIVLGAS